METISSDITLIRTDVTAVKILEDVILAGIGSWVHVIDRETTNFLHKIKTLKGQKIYGFVPNERSRQVLVFGGKQFAILSSYDKFEVLLEPLLADDWLHAAVWISDDEVAVLTAHNVVQIWLISKLELIQSYRSKDNSILYSSLMKVLEEDVLVFAGTVFSEVIIHCAKDKAPLHRLVGHRGVIFSISCDFDKQLIVTTSDDRSVRIWGPNMISEMPMNTKSYWENTEISCRHEVYGHTARVMRNIITRDCIVSVGEDSKICFWGFNGDLLRSTNSHHNASIWAIDVDGTDLVTGGGDLSVVLHPLILAKEYGIHKTIDQEIGNPKKVVFTARNNAVILNEDDKLFYYDMELEMIVNTIKLEHESTYKFVSLSSCKQLVAVTDMCGNLDMFAENCKGEPNIQRLIKNKLNVGKVLSMQWAGNRQIIICSDYGQITVLAAKGLDYEVVTEFTLPTCKERWLTSSAVEENRQIYVFGDRCGNVHIYKKDRRDPVQTLRKVHGRYGPTSVHICNDDIKTTGRDGTIKEYKLTNNLDVIFKRSTYLNFDWVEKFLDRDETIVCGFQERVFVVHDLSNSSRMIEVSCGGGHRSWDATKCMEKINNKYETVVSLMYLKNSKIFHCVFQLSKIVSRIVVDGSHTKEINCMKALKFESVVPTTVFISGGEDTTLRISTHQGAKFKDVVIFKNLSNVRTVRTIEVNKNSHILASAGGRAQICIKKIDIDEEKGTIKVRTESLVDYLIKGTDKERKCNQNWRNHDIDFDPETRIMDVEIIRNEYENITVIAGCSDATLRTFDLSLNNTNNDTFKPINVIKYHKTCILRVQKVSDKYLFTTTTSGIVAIWDLKAFNKENNEVTPLKELKTNKSGVNSIAVKILSDKNIILATGGDDNSIHLCRIDIHDNFAVKSEIVTSNFHCSQVTGLRFLDENLLLSTSIDQRVTLSKWTDDDQQSKLQFLSQSYSDVSDIQGLDVMDNDSAGITLCVHGKGFEVLRLNKKKKNCCQVTLK